MPRTPKFNTQQILNQNDDVDNDNCKFLGKKRGKNKGIRVPKFGWEGGEEIRVFGQNIY